MTRLCLRKAILLTAVVEALALAGATPAIAQTDEFFDPNTLQEIRLTINTRDLRTLTEKYLDNTYYTADLQWKGIRVRNAGVRSRGNSSRNDRKMALRVDADRYVTGQRFLGLKSFVLKNLWTDPSMLRERLAMTMFSRLGQPASRHSVLPPLHQQRVSGALHHPGIGRQRIPHAQPRRERRLSLFLPAAE